MKRITALLFAAVLLASFSAAFAVSSEKVVGDFYDGLAKMKKSDLYGYIDAYGNELTKEHYSLWDEQDRSIIPERHLPKNDLILVGIDRKGAVSPCYMDTTGHVVISSQGWEDARGFSEGLAAVCKDGKWGYINSSGEYVIDPQYDAARDFSCGVAIVDTNDEWFIIDAQGNVLY